MRPSSLIMISFPFISTTETAQFFGTLYFQKSFICIFPFIRFNKAVMAAPWVEIKI